jgi:hypothetical protein
MARALESTWSVVSRHAREKGQRLGRWVVTEALQVFVCYSCRYPVGMLDGVCNQCGTGDPARLSRPFMIFLGVAGFVLIFTLLWVFAF